MAEQEAIDSVKLQLPDNIADFDLNDTSIGLLLDSGLSQTYTLLNAWRVIAAKTSMMTDISESGSSRNLSVLAINARQQVVYWQQMADREDNADGKEQIRRFASHTAKRI